MKRCLLIAVILAVTSVSGSALAKGNSFGVRAGAGFSFTAGPALDSIYLLDEEDRTAKFCGEFDLYLDRYFTPTLALEIGVGIKNQGARWNNGDGFVNMGHLYLEVPILARIDIKGFQVGLGLAMFFALAGKYTVITPEYTDEVYWGDKRWDAFNRVNVGPKIYAGYRFHVGKVSLIPSLSWSIHLINDIDRNVIEEKEPDADLDSYRMRYNNLMLNISLEVPF